MFFSILTVSDILYFLFSTINKLQINIKEVKMKTIKCQSTRVYRQKVHKMLVRIPRVGIVKP
jgi:transposase